MISNATKLCVIYFFKSLYFFSPILTLFYFSRSLNTFQVISLEAMLIIAVLLSEIPTGILADKMGRKYSIMIVTLAYLVGNVWTIYAGSYPEFLLIQVLFGVGIAFESGAVEALVYDSLKVKKQENQMTKVWGSINAYKLFAMVVAVIIGGYISRSHEPETFLILFWCYVVCTGIALIMSFFVHEPKHFKQVEKKNPLELFRKSTIHILRNKSLRRMIYLLVFTCPFNFILLFLFQPYFQMAKVPNPIWGVAMAIGMLIGALLVKYAYKIEEKLGMKLTVFLTSIIPGLLYLMMAFLIGPVLSFIWYILISGVSNLKDPLFSRYLNSHIESHNRATVLSVISMIVSSYLVIMRLIIGAIANFSILISFVVMGAIIILGALAFRIDESHISV